MKRYNPVAKRSFKAKWNVYLFTRISEGKESEIKYEDFKNFILTNDNVIEYTNKYWQKKTDEKVGTRTVAEIYSVIDEITHSTEVNILGFAKKYIEETFPLLMTESDFEKLVESPECYYCKTTKEEIHKLGEEEKLRKKNLRGWTLEIDRLKPNFEYSSDNCVMSCYWCNNAKTDEFSEAEFQDIGKVIGEIFKNRLKQNTIQNDKTNHLYHHGFRFRFTHHAPSRRLPHRNGNPIRTYHRLRPPHPRPLS